MDHIDIHKLSSHIGQCMHGMPALRKAVITLRL